MTASPGKPAVEPIRHRARIGDRDVQIAIRLQNAPDLRQGSLQIVEMFQAVIRDDRIEAPGHEWQQRCIALYEIRRRVGRPLQVHTNHGEGTVSRVEAPLVATEVQDAAARPKIFQ